MSRGRKNSSIFFSVIRRFPPNAELSTYQDDFQDDQDEIPHPNHPGNNPGRHLSKYQDHFQDDQDQIPHPDLPENHPGRRTTLP